MLDTKWDISGDIKSDENKDILNTENIIKELNNILQTDIIDYITIKKEKKKNYVMNKNGEIEEELVNAYSVEYTDFEKLTKDQRKRIKSIKENNGKIEIVLYDRQETLQILYNILKENIGYENITDTGKLKELDVEELLKIAGLKECVKDD